MDKYTISELLREIKRAEADTDAKLPQNSFFLGDDRVVCAKRTVGKSRSPYESNGLTVWLHSNGFIDAADGNFTVFKTMHCGEESAVSFFGGIKNGKEDYTPISVTGASRAARETGVSRYIVYAVKHAWCIVEAMDSLTPNSFWAITKFLRRDPSLKASIMSCMDAVSSKYGLKTFDIPFPPDIKGVGSIVNIVSGTYENSAAYAHASLFGTMALFEIGESERAWREIEKTVVITHENCRLSTFAMPIFYCENADYGMDGESMGDWHTGSGAVLIKETVRYGFGIDPSLDGLKIQFPKYFPANRGEISLNVKKSHVTLRYQNIGAGTRTVTVSGADGVIKRYDGLMDIYTYFIPEDKMEQEILITVCD